MLGELVDGWVDHRGDRVGVSALSESVTKSACAYPTRSDEKRNLVAKDRFTQAVGPGSEKAWMTTPASAVKTAAG